MISTPDANDQTDRTNQNKGEHATGPEDPVTGTTGNVTGEDQAEENKQRDPVS